MMSWVNGFITTVPTVGSCLALLFLVTREQVVVYLLAASLIMSLIVGVTYLVIVTRIYGWQVQVEALVDIGEMLGVTAYLLLTAVVLLILSLTWS
jgi:hypothetical protein